MKTNVPITLCASDQASTAPCKARLKMIETMIQPTLSSMMAEARMTCPTTRRMKFISRTTIATILTEAIDSAVPRNSAVISRLPGSGSMESGSNSPSATPQAKGMRMPMSEANTAARPVWRTSLRSVSMPVSSSSSRMPNCEIASIIAFCSGFFGKQCVLKIGQQQPEQRGPEQQAGDQLPHHRRLPEPQHGFAEQPADDHQRQNLRDEDDFGGAFRRFARGECRAPPPARAEREQQPKPAQCTTGHRLGWHVIA